MYYDTKIESEALLFLYKFDIILNAHLQLMTYIWQINIAIRHSHAKYTGITFHTS